MKNSFDRYAKAFNQSPSGRSTAAIPVRGSTGTSSPSLDPGNAAQRIQELESVVHGLECRLMQLEAALVVTPGGSVELFAPGGLTITAGARVEIGVVGQSITLSPSGINIVSSSKVTVNCSLQETSAGSVKVSTAKADFSGIVKCDKLIANSVVASSYTPGAGNIW